jgi:hypothetical protein
MYSSGRRVFHADVSRDRRTDMTDLIVFSRNFANEHKNVSFYWGASKCVLVLSNAQITAAKGPTFIQVSAQYLETHGIKSSDRESKRPKHEAEQSPS